MKKIIFTIALFVVSNCLLASEDVIIKYYTKTEFKSLAKIIQQHEIDIQLQKEKNSNIYDKIKASDDKIENTREAILYKNSKGVK